MKALHSLLPHQLQCSTKRGYSAIMFGRSLALKSHHLRCCHLPCHVLVQNLSVQMCHHCLRLFLRHQKQHPRLHPALLKSYWMAHLLHRRWGPSKCQQWVPCSMATISASLAPLCIPEVVRKASVANFATCVAKTRGNVVRRRIGRRPIDLPACGETAMSRCCPLSGCTSHNSKLNRRLCDARCLSLVPQPCFNPVRS